MFEDKWVWVIIIVVIIIIWMLGDNNDIPIDPINQSFTDTYQSIKTEIKEISICEPIPIVKSNKKTSIGEDICRTTLEDIFKSPFPSIRPTFLKNGETNRNLEIDCYSEKYNIALEYNGIQHYIYPNRFHKDYDTWIAQLRRDAFKKEVLNKRGIHYIIVPYTIKHANIKSYIIERLPDKYKHLA